MPKKNDASESESLEQDVTLHRPNWGLRGAAAALVALGALGASWVLGAGDVHVADALPLPLLVLAVGLVLSLGVRNANPRPRKVRARLAVDARGVWIDGSRVLARRAVRRAYLQPGVAGAGPTVRLVGRLGAPLLEMQLASESEGLALLDALELGVSHTAIRFSGVSPRFASRWGKLGVSGAAMLAAAAASFLPSQLPHAGGVRLFLYLLAFLLLPALPLLVPMAIDVGADGVLTTWLGRRRFYRYADIASIQPGSHGVELRLHSGEAVTIAVQLQGPPALLGGGAGEPGHLNALLARIQAAHAAAVDGECPVDMAALVARGGRTPADWLREVRSLLRTDAASYRRSAVPEENLWRVAEDATAEETARVGAAVALRTRLDDDGRARLLRVAEASASPRVRVALRAAASAEDDDALVEAMAPYEAEGAR